MNLSEKLWNKTAQKVFVSIDKSVWDIVKAETHDVVARDVLWILAVSTVPHFSIIDWIPRGGRAI